MLPKHGSMPQQQFAETPDKNASKIIRVINAIYVAQWLLISSVSDLSATYPLVMRPAEASRLRLYQRPLCARLSVKMAAVAVARSEHPGRGYSCASERQQADGGSSATDSFLNCDPRFRPASVCCGRLLAIHEDKTLYFAVRGLNPSGLYIELMRNVSRASV